MKPLHLLSLLLVVFISSCSSIKVYSDYDKNVDFSAYKTYAYHKTSIDQVEISDLDKKRILRAIDQQMALKGITKSENPDMLITLFTKATEKVSVNQFNNGWGWGWGWGWGMGWNPWMMGGNQTTVSTSTEGTLFIDFIDAKKKELVWQGEGIGYLTKDVNKKDQVINDFVAKIIGQYPPVKKEKK